jgi:hypothetical protein
MPHAIASNTYDTCRRMNLEPCLQFIDERPCMPCIIGTEASVLGESVTDARLRTCTLGAGPMHAPSNIFLPFRCSTIAL